MKSAPKWKLTLLTTIDQIESHLAVSAPNHARLRLKGVRKRLACARNRTEPRRSNRN
jgi:hypothetical protein